MYVNISYQTWTILPHLATFASILLRSFSRLRAFICLSLELAHLLNFLLLFASLSFGSQTLL
ncbi:hypothetical protein BC835DRAFT_1381174 [Cytidiella melzeri]|nr:hypothetical protein BC835DRAFT_1381174 [Cytidiella melzeri]